MVPLLDEAENLPELYRELRSACDRLGKPCEIIFVDDGSRDNGWRLIQDFAAADPEVRGIRMRRNFGKSAALSAGFRTASGSLIATMDADLQDDPAELPRLIAALDEGYDVVSGWKYPRHDPLSKVLPSRFMNWLTARLTRVQIHDMNCGLKIYRREVVDGLVLHGGQYRFIPGLVAGKGFRVGEIKVTHRPRIHGVTKFGAGRFFTGFMDLLTVLFVTRYVRKPLHVFGVVGMLHFIPGLVILEYLLYLRLAHGAIMGRYPLLVGGVMLMLVGVQFITTGLLAEMIALHSERSEAPSYSIRETAGAAKADN